VTRIVIYENSVNDILDMVQDIKSLGYVMDQDFTWAWHPEDSYTGEQEYAVFECHDEHLVTYLNLKWIK
jgi:hypothetical protein